MIDDDLEISPGGRRRGEQILRLALAQARMRRRRRVTARAGGVAAIVILCLAAFFMLDRVNPAPPQNVIAISPPTTSPMPSPTYIQTDPAIVQRLAIGPQPRRWTTVGDDELLDALANAGQPAGIIYHDGQATLLPR